MKTFIASLCLCACALGLTTPPPNVLWTITWLETNNVPILNGYVPKTNFCYFIVGTKDLSIPLAQWPTLTPVSNWTLSTNGQKVYYSTQVSIPSDGNYFLSIFSSNVWGQVTSPLAVDQTGPVSSPVSSVNLTRP